VSRESDNLYRIDGILLRAGAVTLALVIGVTALAGLSVATSDISSERGLGWGMVLGGACLLGLLWLCPIGLIGAGFTMRRREKRIFAIWQLLKRSGEIPVRALLADSDFERRDLERAVRFLNTRGLGHYVWDRESDVVRDARLDCSTLYFEECDSCGAEISLEIPVTTHHVPRCPFCHDPVCVEGLEERRRKALEAVRLSERPERIEVRVVEKLPTPGSDFSLPLFLLLLVGFWPAALGYACLKWRGSS
jgi:hypothetical protein